MATQKQSALPASTITISPTPLPASEIAKLIADLAALPPLEYESVRIEQAKSLGCRTSILDEEVKKARGDGSEVRNSLFPIIEPHQDPIEPAQLLDEISSSIRKYIVLDPEQADTAALWIAATWLIKCFDLMPLAIINAPEKACGKTQLLTVMGYMAFNPLPTSNASPSVLFRATDKWAPTLLIDEADTFFKDNTELQGMVNAGYARDGYVLRSEAVGDSFEPRRFSVFSAKAIAGIALERHLPDATMSRGLLINLRRKMPHESVNRLRHADRRTFSETVSKLARFSEDFAQQVRYARPALPESLSDRDQDNWEPLLAIADCAGEDWIKRATDAALKLSSSDGKMVSTSNELLADIKYVFENGNVDKISTKDLIAELVADEENAWATYNRGKPLTPKQLAKQLSVYGIKSKTIRMRYDTPKGFDAMQFQDAFARYLTPSAPMPEDNDFIKESNSKIDDTSDSDRY
jgi:hypothetical protein